MKTSEFIFKTIEQKIIKHHGYNCFLSRKYIIADKITELEPDLPEDETSGFLAYNVPGKDRMKMKTTRFLTRKLNLNSGFLPDKIISQIAEDINKEFFTDDVEIKLLKGSQITQAYRNEIGLSSCMTGSNCEYTMLYEENPDRFQLLTMFYSNDSARAIVSLLDNGRYYLDRIYASCEMLKDSMRNYAIKQNWIYRETDKAHDLDICNGLDRELIVSNLNYEDGHIPYMDTFKNGCTCGSGLTISKNGCCDFDLESTDGYIENRYTCDFCSDSLYEDDCFYADDHTLCESCYCENYYSCEYCEEPVYKDDVVNVDNGNSYYCQHCIDYGRIEVYYCEDCNEYFSDCYCIEDKYWVCENCFDSTDYGQCEDCGENFYSENLKQYQGCWYCYDCLPEDEIEEDEIEKITCENYPGQMEINYNE